MKRRFRLIVRDSSWKEITSYTFSSVNEASSNPRVYSPDGIGGFEVSVTVQSGDVLDYVIKQTVKKNDINLNLAFKGGSAVMAIETFRAWCARYMDASRYRLTLEITTFTNEGIGGEEGVSRRVDVAFKRLSPSQLQGGIVKAVLTLQAITISYTEEPIDPIMTADISPAAYPHSYPYAYGGGSYGDTAELSNPFMQDVPLIVTFHGHIESPQIALTQNGTAYATVRFLGLDLPYGSSLTVDAVNGRIYLTDSDGVETDAYDLVDKTQDSFLFARPGTSVAAPNLDPTEATKPSVELKMFQFKL